MEFVSPLLKIVNDDFFANRFEDFLDEFDVGGVVLVFILRFFVAEDDVEGDLVALVDNGALAFRGAPDMEMEDAGDVFQVFVGAGDEFGGGVRKSRFGPENDNVRKHRRIEGRRSWGRKPVLRICDLRFTLERRTAGARRRRKKTGRTANAELRRGIGCGEK